MAKKRILIFGAGAVGGYAGAHMVRAGEDVTFIDPWPEHVEHLRKHGLKISHAAGGDAFVVPVRALHVTDAQNLAKEAPFDIAFVCMKSYDTAWSTMLVSQYLAPAGYVVSLQNCINEATIAGVVGWGKTLGSIASAIMVGLMEPGHVERGGPRGGDKYTVFRVGEVHGRITPRAEEVRALLAHADSAKVTENLWGERWSKLVANATWNGVTSCTGLTSKAAAYNEPVRHFATRLAGEAIRIGQALGYQLEDILHIPPELLAQAAEGDEAAMTKVRATHHDAASKMSETHLLSMGQDMVKRRRTEIEYLNGFVVAEGEKIGIDAPCNRVLTDLVKRVERGDLKADPKNIADLRLN